MNTLITLAIMIVSMSVIIYNKIPVGAYVIKTALDVIDIKRNMK